MIGRLNHVAIAVPDLKAAAEVYRNTLGAKVSAEEEQPEHGVSTVFIELPNTKIELLGTLGENSPIAGFLERNPNGGIHHLCYEVPDIKAARDRLVEQGARARDVRPRDEVLRRRQGRTHRPSRSSRAARAGDRDGSRPASHAQA
jgi:methylmalonyl-CoA/ethylmalonyl-CoA epimerase